MNQPMTAADPTRVVGRRILAYFIDGFFAVLLVGAIFLATADLTQYEGVDSCSLFETYNVDTSDRTCIELEANGDESVLLFNTNALYLTYAASMAYGLFFVLFVQGLTGWTPGKLLTGIRVVNEQGTGPGIGRAFIRWILFLVDGLCSGLVGFIVMLTSKGHRRVGDMAAKTFVVRSSARGTPVLVPGLTTAAMPVTAGAYYDPNQMPTTPPVFPTPSTPTPSTPTPATPSDAGAPSGPDAASEPQWDAERNAWIQWDATAQAWKSFDESTKEWKPLS